MKEARDTQLCRRLMEIAGELRDISQEIGKSVHIMTAVTPERGKTASRVAVGHYTIRRFFSGYEEVAYDQITVRPDAVRFGGLPSGIREKVRKQRS